MHALWLGLTLLPVWGVSQEARRLVLDFGAPGSREVFFGPETLQTIPAETFRQELGTAEIEIPKDAARLYVWDRVSGNLASKPVAELRTPRWEMRKEDFAAVARVWVRVEHAGKPVSAAQVRFQDARGAREEILDESAQGQIAFLNVRPGEIRLETRYRSEGATRPPLKMSFEVGLERGQPEPVLTVSISEPVATLGAASSGTSSEAPASDSSSPAGGSDRPSGGLRPWIGFGIVFALLAGTGYALYRKLKERPELLEASLKKLQVPIPDTSEPLPPPPAQPPTPAAPDPILLEPPAASDAPSISSSTAPRLIGDSGEVWPLTEPSAVLGRDVGLAISLPGEETVSRRHAELRVGPEGVSVVDLGSTNGTFVNARSIEGETPLQPGDTVQFGAVRCRYEA